MRPPKSSLPSYRLHKPTNQAVVTLSGVDVYLGRYNSIESREAYDRAVETWLASGRQRPNANDSTVNELIVRYVRHADEYYRKPDGRPTGEADNVRNALKPLRKLFGPTRAAEFGPLELETVRDQFIKADLCRKECNRRTRMIVRMFRWGVSKRMIPADVWQSLTALESLKEGRSKARESVPVGPVADEDVDAVLPSLAPQVRAMVELQRLSGCRPGEIVQVRTRDLEMTGDVWTYKPASHKSEHRHKQRIIHFGPKAIEILKPWLRANRDDHLFRPCDAVDAKNLEKRQARATPLWPSHVKAQARNRKTKPKRTPGASYDVHAYRRAVVYAITKANKARAKDGLPLVPHWHLHQLRHSAATRLEREFGMSAAQVVLGHSSPNVTKIYTAADMAKAAEAMRRIG
jgi:integrase